MKAKQLIVLTLLAILLLPTSACGGGGEEVVPPYGPPQVHLPEDEGSHPGFPTEWWYGNFSLTGSGGGEYGGMVAYFNSGLRILSISDLEAEVFYSEVSHSTPDYAEGILNLRWGARDHWFRTDPDSLSYHLESYSTEVSLNLSLSSEKPPLLVGGDGLIEWTQGSSYYYSLTRLQVEGQIELSGRVIDFEGIGWMDHQWMDPAVESGWDWFSVQLDNQAEIVFWQIVNPDESIESRDLTIMFPDNSVYHTRDFTLEKIDSWVSPESGNAYGILWQLREENNDLDLEIRARYPQQEIQGIFFWEGNTTVSGTLTGETVSGVGYAELTLP